MIKNTLISTAILAMLYGTANASNNIYPVGSNLSQGGLGSPQSVHGASANTNWLSANQTNEDNYGLGLSVNFGLEFNEFTKVGDKFTNNVQPALDALNQSGISDSDKITAGLNAVNEINDMLSYASDNTYIQGYLGLSLPVVATLKPYGGVSVDITSEFSGKARLLTQNTTPVSINTTKLLDSTAKPVDALEINAALYLKSAAHYEIGIGYSNSLGSIDNRLTNLHLGIKANIIQAELSKSLLGLQKYITQSSTDGFNFADAVQSDIEEMKIDDWQTQVGLDLNAMWVEENWLGAVSLLNINSPTFVYNELGVITDVTDLSQWTSTAYGNTIALKEKVVLVPQLKIDGAYYNQTKTLMIATSLDVNSSVDFLNNPYQWVGINGSYSPDGSSGVYNYFIPDLRVGYRQNLVGSEKKYVSAGLTFLGVNLDVAVDPFELEAYALNVGAEIYF